MTIDLVLNAGIPVVCALLAALVIATRVWRPRYARIHQHSARRRYR